MTALAEAPGGPSGYTVARHETARLAASPRTRISRSRRRRGSGRRLRSRLLPLRARRGLTSRRGGFSLSSERDAAAERIRVGGVRAVELGEGLAAVCRREANGFLLGTTGRCR